MSTAPSRTTVTVALKKGTEFIFESPEVNKVDGTALVIGESGHAMRFGLDTVKTVRITPERLDRATEELMKLYYNFARPYYTTPYKW
ncbi:hypothetical protein [Glycomyces sp. NPDC047010]|uniref:hypothetical protein n=1 Tax=Glycomyces sp. NPDC047010 TaxID=3155023 RepID=UPI0033EE91F2